MKRDYYEILGVTKTSSADEIKKAYRKVAMRPMFPVGIAMHPDVGHRSVFINNQFLSFFQMTIL